MKLDSCKVWSFTPVFDDEITLPPEVAGKLDDAQKALVLNVVKTLQQQHNQKINELGVEMGNLGQRAQLSDSERKKLEDRVKALSQQGATKEELHRQEVDGLKTDFGTKIKALEEERDGWRNRHTTTVITSSIVTAGAANKAYNPDQLVAIMSPQTSLVEELQDGKPTGRLIPTVKFSDKDKDGKPVTLDLSVPDAVKRMKAMDAFANLFEHEGVDGTGTRRRAAQSGTGDLSSLAKDPRAFREARSKGLIR